MTENKRFTDNGIEEIENQSFTDNLTGKTYWIDNGLDEIINLLNALHEENQKQEKIIRVKKEQLNSLKELNTLLFDIIDGMVAYKKLQDLGYYFDDD